MVDAFLTIMGKAPWQQIDVLVCCPAVKATNRKEEMPRARDCRSGRFVDEEIPPEPCVVQSAVTIVSVGRA